MYWAVDCTWSVGQVFEQHYHRCLTGYVVPSVLLGHIVFTAVDKKIQPKFHYSDRIQTHDLICLPTSASSVVRDYGGYAAFVKLVSLLLHHCVCWQTTALTSLTGHSTAFAPLGAFPALIPPQMSKNWFRSFSSCQNFSLIVKVVHIL